MQLIQNPLAQPEFLVVLVKTGILLLLGLTVMSVTQVRDLGKMARSLGFRKFRVWIFILPSLLVLLYSGRLPFLALVAFMLSRSAAEMMRMLRIPPFYKKVVVLNLTVALAVVAVLPELTHLLPIFFVLSTFLAAGVRNQLFEVVKNVSFVIIGCIWVGFPLALLVLLYDSPGGIPLVTVVIGMVVVSDVFAYLLGGIARKVGVGTAPLASNISPNKVVAGLAGNVIGALISFATFGLSLGYAWPTAIAIVLLSGIMGAYGDIAESMVKRYAGVKDSSGLIPYHGGMLDRIDSLLFVAPTIYLTLSVAQSIAVGLVR